MYIGEAKSIFAALYDAEIASYAGFSASEISAIQKVILTTYRITAESSADIQKNRDGFVLKEDAATRGIGVVLGEAVKSEDWNALLNEYSRRGGVAQKAVATPVRDVFYTGQDGIHNQRTEYFGADWFFYGESFCRCVSRAHVSKVFNVGNGGCEVPVLIMRGSPYQRIALAAGAAV